ncbi:Uncharacterised protein [Mycobacteroides abscessus subsp. massiliense]|nr:Uncharacterised protein [Mycobacteroides abscessus subsp. massiliense]SKY71730.1 Uncharacterised protein [Mycobacteroides abscessus subsp. massiliense]
MTTQAITDIKELVGEMPGQACEFPDWDGLPACDREAAWAARVHWTDVRSRTCRVVVVALCESHKREMLEVAATELSTCILCGSTIASVLRVMPL